MNPVRQVTKYLIPRAFQLTEPEKIAANIIGYSKVVGYNAACQVWNACLAQSIPVMSFSEATLRQCAEENNNGADWRVVYVHGLSLRQQEEIRGRNREKQPCFNPDHTWWLGDDQNSWGNQSVKAGYRLLDFTGRFGGMQWQTQEAEITKLGKNFERAEEQAVAEACFTFFVLSDRNERLLENVWHRGRLLTCSGYRVSVGFFDQYGFEVWSCWSGYAHDILRAVLSRKS